MMPIPSSSSSSTTSSSFELQLPGHHPDAKPGFTLLTSCLAQASWRFPLPGASLVVWSFSSARQWDMDQHTSPKYPPPTLRSQAPPVLWPDVCLSSFERKLKTEDPQGLQLLGFLSQRAILGESGRCQGCRTAHRVLSRIGKSGDQSGNEKEQLWMTAILLG